MLAVGTAAAVGAAQGPPVGVGVDLVGVVHEPRFDGDDQTGLQLQTAPRTCVVGHMRIAVHRAADSVPAELGVHAIPVRVRDLGYGRPDVAHPIPGPRRVDPGDQGALGAVDDVEVFLAGGADHDRQGRVRYPPFQCDREVDREQITVPQRVVVREAVQHGVVHAGAQHLAERAGAEAGVVVDVARLGARLPDHPVRECVEFEQVHSDVGGIFQRGQHRRHELPGGAHLVDLSG